jgi:hypothetical protein
LEIGTCTCGFWYDTKIPCSHAIALIARTPSKTPTSYLPNIFKVEVYKEFYSLQIPQIDFEDLTLGNCFPPPVVRKRGRPITSRIPSAYEGGPRKSSKCSQCLEKGHNSHTCPLVGNQD